MKTSRVVAAAVVAACSIWLSPFVARPVAQVAQAKDANGVLYTRAQAEFVTQHLYRAIFQRDPDPAGMNTAASEVERGGLGTVIEKLFQSQEFRQRMSSKSADELLDAFYKGIFGRAPDTAGSRTYFTQLQRREYANVLAKLVTSPEFETKMPGRPPARSLNPLERPVVDNGRQGGDFGRQGGDFGGRDFRGRGDYQFSSPEVMACHDAVMDRLYRDRAPAEIMFETAGITPGPGSGETVRGRAHEVGRNNRVLTYTCDVQRGTVRQADYRYQR